MAGLKFFAREAGQSRASGATRDPNEEERYVLRFSIIIPCLNRHAELRAAIASCLEQTFADFELLVIDDKSDPPLKSVCDEFDDCRIRYLRNADNIGVSGCRNLGIDAARGDYVSFLDSDDVYLPTRLEVLNRHITAANSAPQILFHRQTRLLSSAGLRLASPARLPSKEERLDEYILLGGNFIQTNTFVIARALARRVRFDAACKVHEDTKFVIACWLEARRFEACAEILSEYRDLRHAERLSKRLNHSALYGMLTFSEQKCSAKAQVGLAAYACSETSLIEAPRHVLNTLWKAARAGVPPARCLVYLARSVFGTRTIDMVLLTIRQLTLSRSYQSTLN
jgi:glycosyltransferase involved in cell wall biosynthesis